MIKATDKKVQQYLLHATLGEQIGEIEGHKIVKFVRGDDKGFLAMNDKNVVVKFFKRTDRMFKLFVAKYPTVSEQIVELEDCWMF